MKMKDAMNTKTVKLVLKIIATVATAIASVLGAGAVASCL
jgi:hypothetical protein